MICIGIIRQQLDRVQSVFVHYYRIGHALINNGRHTAYKSSFPFHTAFYDDLIAAVDIIACEKQAIQVAVSGVGVCVCVCVPHLISQ